MSREPEPAAPGSGADAANESRHGGDGARDAGPRSGPGEPGVESEAYWREYMTEGDPQERSVRRLLSHLPDGPRCKACAAPFSSVGGAVMRAIGKGPSTRNPNLCEACFSYMRKHRGGAEIDVTLLFADVRGSTTLAETMAPAAYRALLDRFYRAATKAIFGNDGSIDKFVGDEVMAMFFHLAAGDEHPAKAVLAARQLLEATGHGRPEGPWLPLGAGVLTGIAWVGAVGDDTHVELTALGDAVNVAARLASLARMGEILISTETAARAGLESAGERRVLDVKGKAEPIEVVSLRVGAEAGAAAGPA